MVRHGWQLCQLGPARGRPMTPDREAHILRAIDTLATVDEAHWFRQQLSDQGEQMTATVMAALRDRIDVMAKREGRTG